MRTLLIAVLAGALAACTQGPAATTKTAAAPAAGAPAALTCDQTVTRTIDLTGPGAQDLVTVRALPAPPVPEGFKDEDLTEGGRLCTGATVLLTLHRGRDGANLLTFAKPIGQLEMVGGGGGPFTPEALTAVLTTLATLEVGTTATAPAPTEPSISLHQDAAAYRAAKAAGHPMVCHAESVHDRACLYVDPDFSGMLSPLFTRTTM